MVWPLFATMSSVPDAKAFIVQEAVVWKSGWAERDSGKNFVV